MCFRKQAFLSQYKRKIFIRNTKEVEEITAKRYQVRLRKQETIACPVPLEESGTVARIEM